MAVDIRKHSLRLRQLCEEYYKNIITYPEYRDARNIIFDEIDKEQGFATDGLWNESGDNEAKAGTMGEEVHITHE